MPGKPTLMIETQQIVLDVRALDEVTPSFLAFLVRLRQDARKTEQTVHLIGVTGKLRRVLEKTGLGRLFTYDT